jgi:RimJ/RimL family protein N-acetyltransferase
MELAMSTPDFRFAAESDMVRLRPVVQDDWAEMFRVASDPLIWAVHPESNRFEEPAFRRYFDEALASGQALTILDRATGEIVGSSRYAGYDQERSEVEIGWTFLARRCWGGVWNRQLKRLMLDRAFQFVETVIFKVGEANLRSRGAMAKIGGVLRPGLIDYEVGGRTVPYVVYEIRKPGVFPT